MKRGWTTHEIHQIRPRIVEPPCFSARLTGRELDLGHLQHANIQILNDVAYVVTLALKRGSRELTTRFLQWGSSSESSRMKP